MTSEIVSKDDIKPGEIYEDSYGHPCVCVHITDEISGISLIDGSYPRTENISEQKLIKLSSTEAWEWRINGPAQKPVAPAFRWWEQKPPECVNPGLHIENLYFFALYQVEWNQKIQEILGSVKHEWHDVQSKIVEDANDGKAELQFSVTGENGTARVKVLAFKSKHDWLIEQLEVDIADQTVVLLEQGKPVD